LAARLLDFAMDFEVAYRTDNWSDVEGHFSPDAKYEVRNTSFDCSIIGPKNIVAGFKKSIDGFDRNLKRKLLVTEGPTETVDSVSFVWQGCYTAPDLPPLKISARQTLRFADGKICSILDEYQPGEGKKISAWLESHGQSFDPSYL